MENIEILIVEDDYSAASHLRNMLTNIGYNISKILANGRETIKYVENNKVDIILMDIELEGDLNGVELVKIIQKKYNPFIIYITALGDEKTFKSAKATFPDFFLSKPFNLYQLLDIIDKIISDNSDTVNSVSFRNDYFFLKTKNVYKKYHIDSIIFLKADTSYTNFFIKINKEIVNISTSINLKSTLLKLKAKTLIRIHRSYAINIKEIDSIEGRQIKLFDVKEVFTVQESYWSKFCQFIKKV